MGESGRRRRGRDERGAAALEFGLIAPVLVLLVFGVIEFGFMINRDMIVGNASRDGARQASLGASYSEIKTAVQSELSENGISTGAGTTIVICAKAANTPCKVDSGTGYAAAATSGANVAVTVSFDYTWVTPVVSSMFGDDMRLSQYTQMRVE